MDIKKIVTDYTKAENTDYAIMVTGVWGSGKTFCWNHTLKQAIEEIKIPGQDTENTKKYSSARVSLFGLTDVNQIRQRMLEACVTDKVDSKLFSFVKNKKTIIGRIISGLTRKAAKKYADIEEEELEEIYAIACDLTVLKNTVFCFDDLERLNPQLIQDTLGYINSLIEAEHLKIIVLCNEDELFSSDEIYEELQYKKYKEKVIRFTCEYKTDIKTVLTTISKDICKNSSDYILKQSERISRTYDEAECSNIRTLKFNLDVFELIYQPLMRVSCNEDERIWLMGHYLFLTMLYSIEYKRGASPDDFDSLSSLNEEREYDIDWEGINKVLQNNQNQEKKDEEEEISFLDEVRNRYYGGKNPLTLGASRAIMEYIKTGELNEVQLETEIQNSLSLIRNQMGSKTQQLLGQMNQFLILEDAELRKLADGALQGIRNHEYDYFSYPIIFHYLQTFITTSMWNSISEHELYNLTMAAMTAKEPETKFVRFWDHTMTGAANETANFKAIVDRAQVFNSQLQKKEQGEEIRNKILNMLNGYTNWNNAFDIMQPELHLVDVNEVFEAFKHCKNADRRMFVAYVQKRLNEIRFKEEQPFFESFRDLLQNYQTLVSPTGVSYYLNKHLLNILLKIYPQKP